MGLIIAAVLFFVFGLALESTTSWIAIRGARKHHPKLWTHSGKPTLLGNGDLGKAWPLVAYYRDRKYLEPAQHDDQHLAPISDTKSLAFAEKLRGPLLYTYYAAYIGIAVCLLLVAATAFLN